MSHKIHAYSHIQFNILIVFEQYLFTSYFIVKYKEDVAKEKKTAENPTTDTLLPDVTKTNTHRDSYKLIILYPIVKNGYISLKLLNQREKKNMIVCNQTSSGLNLMCILIKYFFYYYYLLLL